MVISRTSRVILLAIAAAVGGASVRADTLLLKSGGRVEGQIQQRPPEGATGDQATYIVRVDAGILLRLAADEVGRVVETSADEREYERLLPRMPDTAAGHAAMAQWCQKRGLSDPKDFHWQEVLRHEPDQPEARRALGYNRVRGEWVRADEFMQAQGYVRHKGTWRLPQQVADEQARDEVEVAEKTWRRDIAMWRSWLNGRRRDEALQRLQTIDDPLASAGLAQLLAEESDAGVREIYADQLARLATPLALDALIQAAIDDPDVEVRLRCIDHVRQLGAARAVGAWTGFLQSRDNRTVNRAGVALGRLGRPEAVGPLIDALVTQHETLVKPTASIQPSFGSANDGSGGLNGLSIGGGPKVVRRQLRNQSVLDALVALTSQNYRFSQADWKDWYIQQRSLPEDVNLRRD